MSKFYLFDNTHFNQKVKHEKTAKLESFAILGGHNAIKLSTYCNMRKLLIFTSIFIATIAATGLYLSLKETMVNSNLTLYGNVDVRQVDLGFRVLGRVHDMPFQEGATVKAGTKLAKLDKQPYEDEVRQAKANVRAVQVSLANQQRILERRKDIVSQGAVSEEEYQTAISSRDILKANLSQAKAALGAAMTSLHDTELYAPADGIILTRIREPGSIVTVGEPIYTLSLTSPVWIRAFVSGPDLGRIYPGMEAQIFTDTIGSKVYTGHIGFISPVAEFTPKTVESTELRTDLVYRLRIIADNPDKGLRQGMPVTVKLTL